MTDKSSSPSATRDELPLDVALLGAVARGWCHAGNTDKEMDTKLAMAIAVEVAKLFSARSETAEIPPDFGSRVGSTPSATPCSGQHLSKDLHEALEFIKKLSAVIAATHPDAFKGRARGENAPYDLAKAADNFVHQPRSVFPPPTPEGEFTVGDYTLREGMERGKVWIEHESGEGGDFTATKVEAAIAAFYKEHF